VAPAPDADRSRRLYVGRWRIDLTRRDTTPKVLTDRAIARTAAAALDVAAGRFAPGSLAIVLTDDAELAELNAEHLGKRGPTDVLSFPMLGPAAFSSARRSKTGEPARQNANARRPSPGEAPRSGGRIHLGDIAISVERAIEQAEAGRGGQTGDVRWSPADELRLLVIHGTLHICGWDHAEPDEEAAMRSLERSLLRVPGQGPVRPSRCASAAASVRPRTPSFERMFET
jgi:probable rRNA maturation factor